MIKGRAELGAFLASEIASRLASVAPSEIHISCADGAVQFTSVGVWWGASSHVESLVDQPGDLEKNIEIAAFNSLDVAQDYCSEVLRLPWPPSYGDRAVIPSPHAVLRSGVLLMWFGDELSPALVLDSIELLHLLS